MELVWCTIMIVGCFFLFIVPMLFEVFPSTMLRLIAWRPWSKNTDRARMERRPFIDCVMPNFVPDGLAIEEHNSEKHFRWDPKLVTLHYTKDQMKECVERGRPSHFVQLRGLRHLNANVLDYLLEHPVLIPNYWFGWGFRAYFWGTIYRDLDTGRTKVRYLYRNRDSGKWDWDTDDVDDWRSAKYPSRCPAVILAN